MGSSQTSTIRKGELNLTSEEVLSLSNVLHVSESRPTLVSVHLLSKVWVKLVFEFDRVVLTRSGVFVGKDYCSDGSFILNVEKHMIMHLLLLILLNH